MSTTTGLGQRLVPSLLVRDMAETLSFYEKLGFRVTGESGTWAEVRRDSLVMQFHTEPPPGTPSTPVCSGTFYVLGDDVAALAEQLRGKVDFAWGPEVMEYGMLEFGVRDPNGYHLAFTQEA